MLSARTRERGVTLVELMVGVAVGAFVILAVTLFFTTQISGNTDMVKAMRLNQEMRTIMDLMVRDVRRASYWGNAISGVWYEDTPGVTTNPLRSITVGTTVDPSASTSATALTYSYDVNGNGAIEDDENFKLRLNNGAVELVKGIANPVTTVLSDTGATTITGLDFSTTSTGQGVAAAPATLTISCVVAGSNPTLTLREIIVTLSGRLADDGSVTRTLRETVRIRADSVSGSCPAVIS